MITLESDGGIVYCQFPDIYESNPTGAKLEKLKPISKSDILQLFGYPFPRFRGGNLFRIGETLFICNIGGSTVRPQVILYEVKPVPESRQGFEINLDNYPGLAKALKIMAMSANRSIKELIISILYKEIIANDASLSPSLKEEYIDTIV